MLYKEQLQREENNKQIFNTIVNNIPKEEFINFYKTHNQKETLVYYNIPTIKLLTKILKEFNYGFSFKKCLNKGKPASRSHESYIQGGLKSAETQKQTWENKSKEEKKQWAIKQSLAHKSFSSLQKKLINKNIEALSSVKLPTKIDFKETLIKNNISFETNIKIKAETFNYKVNNYLFNLVSSTTPVTKNYHKEKSEIANANGYRCIHIFDWDDQDKIIKNLLLPKEKIAARKCKIKEVAKQDTIDFIETNHLQGYAKDEIRLGLYYENQLVSIMTFGKPRYNKKYQYELIRYCASKQVIGGGEKLFKYFIKEYQPDSIISYCDTSKFVGNIYTKLGFTLLRKPQPSKHWYNVKTKEHYLDSLVRKQGFSRLIHHCDASEDNLSTSDNKELMINAGFVEVYDCGQSSYLWTKKKEA